MLARIDYRALAQGFGVAYQEIVHNGQLDSGSVHKREDKIETTD